MVIKIAVSLFITTFGGEGGIRTPVGRKPEAVFKTAAIGHSATSPRRSGWQGGRESNPQPTVLETATLPIELPPYPIMAPRHSLKLRMVTHSICCLQSHSDHSHTTMSEMRPAPMVRPPSRMAKRWPFSIATGAINTPSIETLSPGMTISTPAGRVMDPVTSVVRK